jgi:predicted secreted hydrolase
MSFWFAALVSLAGCEPVPAPQSDVGDSPLRLLDGMGGTPDPGFARAVEPRPFVFPADHGPHPAFATEWWYFTGNVFDTQQRRFGYQLTLFRIGLSPEAAPEDSTWRANEFYMGHLAVSDVENARHHQAERFSRAAAGLAGARADPLQVWLGPWSIRGEPGETFPLRIEASTGDFGLDLEVAAGHKARVLQGDRGLSPKSAAPGNASYYYSHTRLPTRGQITIEGRGFDVTGSSWFDREWSSSALADDQAGWDWFALQLDDGRDLMFYRMRGHDGQAQPFSRGVLVDDDGASRPLRHDEVDAEPLRYWTAADGVSYPVSWRLAVPGLGLDLQVEAAFDAQRMDTTVRYWEGAVDVRGSHRGVGYLELSGYGDSPD